MKTRRTCILLVATLALAACGDASGDDDTGDTPDAAPAGGDGGTGDPDTLIGKFEVELVAASDDNDAHTTVLGTIYDGAQPSTIVWETAAEDGDCVLYTPRVPFCATPCGSSKVCVEDDTCAPYASKQVVGDVTVTGLATTDAASTFVMAPVAKSYQPAGVTLAYPPFAEGDPVNFAAAGSDFTGAFTLAANGIAPLALTSPDLALDREQAAELTWTPPGAGAPTTLIQVKLDISHHGGTRGKIECLAPDTGSLTLGAGIITELIDLGVAGFPTVIVSRVNTGSTVIAAGRVDLEVRSEVERPLTVVGVDSCDETSDCEDGEVCRDDLTCG